MSEFTHEHVPAGQRVSAIRIAVVSFGLTTTQASVLLGGQVDGVLELTESIVLIVGAGVLLAALAGCTAYYAFRTGLSFAQQCARLFGRRTGRLVTVFVGVALMAWFAGGASSFTIAIADRYGLDAPSTTTLAVVGSLVISTSAIVGFRGLTWVSVSALPLLILLGVRMLSIALGITEPTSWEFVDDNNMTAWPQVLAMVVSAWILSAVVAIGDIARFAATARSAVLGAVAGFVIGVMGLMLVGIQLSDELHNPDTTKILTSLVPYLGLTLLTLSVWSTSDSYLYSAGLALSHLTGLSFRPAAALCAAASAGTCAYFVWLGKDVNEGLALMGIAIAAVGGSTLGQRFAAERAQPWHGWVAIFTGSAVGALNPLALAPVFALVAALLTVPGLRFGERIWGARLSPTRSLVLTAALPIAVVGGLLALNRWGVAPAPSGASKSAGESGAALLFVRDPHVRGPSFKFIDDHGTVRESSNPNFESQVAGAVDYPAWSPDGRRLAYAAGVGTSGLDIFVVDWDGRNKINLTNSPGFDAEPAWSPDGSQIAFTSRRDATCHPLDDCKSDVGFVLYIVDANGGTPRRLTQLRYPSYHPSWSTRGIAFSSTRSDEWDPDEVEKAGGDLDALDDNGNEDIYLVQPDGEGLTRLTTDEAEDIDPAWSPDGDQIVFASRRGYLPQVYRMNADGSDQVQLTSGPFFGSADRYNPGWSPDGRKISFTFATRTSGEHATQDIYVMRADGTDVLNLTSSPTTCDWAAAWYPGPTTVAPNRGNTAVIDLQPAGVRPGPGR